MPCAYGSSSEVWIELDLACEPLLEVVSRNKVLLSLDQTSERGVSVRAGLEVCLFVSSLMDPVDNRIVNWSRLREALPKTLDFADIGTS